MGVEPAERRMVKNPVIVNFVNFFHSLIKYK
jgi:hypothetical protein